MDPPLPPKLEWILLALWTLLLVLNENLLAGESGSYNIILQKMEKKLACLWNWKLSPMFYKTLKHLGLIESGFPCSQKKCVWYEFSWNKIIIYMYLCSHTRLLGTRSFMGRIW